MDPSLLVQLCYSWCTRAQLSGAALVYTCPEILNLTSRLNCGMLKEFQLNLQMAAYASGLQAWN